jgi:hypothetical protein
MAVVQRPHPRLSERFLLRLSESRVLEGLWIGTLPTPAADPAVTNQRVQEALETIRAHDPRRFKRLGQYLERIWVRVQTGGNTGCSNFALKACELDPRYVLREDVTPTDIASVIVHEATHARLRSCGIGFSEELRSRVEAVCRHEEYAFSERLPPPQGEKIRDKLRRMEQVREDFWSDALSVERDKVGLDEAWLYLGVPRWLVPVFKLIRAVVRFIRRVVRSISRVRAA